MARENITVFEARDPRLHWAVFTTRCLSCRRYEISHTGFPAEADPDSVAPNFCSGCGSRKIQFLDEHGAPLPGVGS